MKLIDIVPERELESYDCEFKQILNDESKAKTEEEKEKAVSWVRTIAGFANNIGGYLYVGVDDKTKNLYPLSSKIVDQQVLLLQREIRQRLTFPLSTKVKTYPIKDGKRDGFLLEVHILPSLSKPVGMKVHGADVIYTRDFGSTRSATIEEIVRMVMESSNISFDVRETAEEYNQKDFTKLNNRYSEVHGGAPLTLKALSAIGFLGHDGRLTSGAELFEDGYSGGLTKVVAVKWPGIDKGSDVYLAREVFKGNILDGIEFGKKFISSKSISGARKTPNGLDTFSSYPGRSVEEGLANAFGHRNYFLNDTQIEINIFVDRLEITSPGSLLGISSLKKEKNIASITPRRRNPVITAVLEACKYMDNMGTGFDLIANEYNGYGEAHRPFVSSDESSFTLTLPDLCFQKGVIDEDGAIPNVTTLSPTNGKHDLKILAFCYIRPRTAGEIASYLGLTNSTRFRSDALGKLEKEGYLHVNKEGRYPLYSSARNKVYVID